MGNRFVETNYQAPTQLEKLGKRLRLEWNCLPHTVSKHPWISAAIGATALWSLTHLPGHLHESDVRSKAARTLGQTSHTPVEITSFGIVYQGRVHPGYAQLGGKNLSPLEKMTNRALEQFGAVGTGDAGCQTLTLTPDRARSGPLALIFRKEITIDRFNLDAVAASGAYICLPTNPTPRS